MAGVHFSGSSIDSALFAKLADNETVTGDWTFATKISVPIIEDATAVLIRKVGDVGVSFGGNNDEITVRGVGKITHSGVRMKFNSGAGQSIEFTEAGITQPDTDASHNVTFVWAGSNVTADRTITIFGGDADRSLTLTGDATLDQDVSSTGSPVFDNTTVTRLGLRDTDSSHTLGLRAGSDLTADRDLTFVTGDAARTLTLTGNATLNQDTSTTGSPTFAALTVDNLVFNGNDISSTSGDITLTPTGNVLIANAKGLVIGHTAQITASNTSELQVLGTSGADGSMIVARFSANASAPSFNFLKSRSGTIGSNAIVVDNDMVGQTKYLPDDGVDFSTIAAQFHAEVDDATPSAGDIGMAFVWQQMPGGAGAFRETMRLDAAGDLSVVVGGIDIAASQAYSVAGTAIISDSAGTATLRNIDALDATTEDTIEAAIDTLDNLASAAALPWTGMATGTDGEVPTFDSSGNPAFAAAGAAGTVFTGNGVGAAPSFQAAAGGLNNNFVFSYDTSTQAISVGSTYQGLNFSNNGELDGWTHSTGTSIFGCNQTGKYLVTVNVTMEKSTGGTAELGLRALFNTVEVAGSMVGEDLVSNNVAMTFSKTFTVNATTGQNLEIEVASTSTNVSVLPSPDPGGATADISASIDITRKT